MLLSQIQMYLNLLPDQFHYWSEDAGDTVLQKIGKLYNYMGSQLEGHNPHFHYHENLNSHKTHVIYVHKNWMVNNL